MTKNRNIEPVGQIENKIYDAIFVQNYGSNDIRCKYTKYIR